MQTIEIRRQAIRPRAMAQVAEALADDAVIAYPTETGYNLGCAPGSVKAQKRLARLKGLDERHTWTLLCSDVSCLGTYARLHTPLFRLVKRVVPGPYTFILNATSEVPRQLQQKKRKTIGIRISDEPLVAELTRVLEAPLVTTSARAAGETETVPDSATLAERFGHELDLLLDAGPVPPAPSTVVDLTGEQPVIERRGAGDPEPFKVP
jgi:tRNA threonylcarbamoyl adenosine modification protein (Sua5/YciO/YrdC/YwlC family)